MYLFGSLTSIVVALVFLFWMVMIRDSAIFTVICLVAAGFFACNVYRTYTTQETSWPWIIGGVGALPISTRSGSCNTARTGNVGPRVARHHCQRYVPSRPATRCG